MIIKRRWGMYRFGKKGVYGFFILMLLTAFINNPSQPDYLSWASKELTVKDNEGFIKGVIAGPLEKVSTIKTNYFFFTIYKTTVNDNKKEYSAIGIFDHFYWLNSPDKKEGKSDIH